MLNDYALLLHDHVTLRSESGNRHAVMIRGRGYKKHGEGLMIVGNNVTIADLTVSGMRNHAISIKPARGARIGPRIYNVHLYRTGTQHIKGNKPGTGQGVVACSLIGNTAIGVAGDYNGAIDLHGAADWILRDNVIYNIRGDGSGCEIDKDCGTYISGPSILVWNVSRNTVIERNHIIDGFRNIALGLGRGHNGGVIRNNIIIQNSPGDAGIELQTAKNILVENNIVILQGGYPGAIEFRGSSDIEIRENYVTAPPHDRGNNQRVTLTNNQTGNAKSNGVQRHYQSIKTRIDQIHAIIESSR